MTAVEQLLEKYNIDPKDVGRLEGKLALCIVRLKSNLHLPGCNIEPKSTPHALQLELNRSLISPRAPRQV
jgi:hypothetical protein